MAAPGVRGVVAMCRARRIEMAVEGEGHVIFDGKLAAAMGDAFIFGVDGHCRFGQNG